MIEATLSLGRVMEVLLIWGSSYRGSPVPAARLTINTAAF